MTETNGYKLLPTIESPADLKKLKISYLSELAKELRQFIIETVSRTGGHLGSNLGAVELTIALHYIYEAPQDLIVWDVGAQAYSHKILTGRFKQFHTNRQYGGISGFPRKEESPYDAFTVGHSSTSISAALGMAVARDLKGEEHKTIAVIGDGAMTGGLAFEGLNNAGVAGHDLTVILNDNRMAISPNVGALSNYLSSIRGDPRFEKIKDTLWQIVGKLPRGSKLRRALHGVDAGIRAMLVPGLWFERLGFRFVGPIDGHNLPEMLRMFKWLKGISGPVLVHVLTEKGRGYPIAKSDRTLLHGVSRFDPHKGPLCKSVQKHQQNFCEQFSDELCHIAEKDDRIIAITPAMIEGSALYEFQERFPDRCFDVGIAEQHALTFAAGLATNGMKPVVAIYSSFLQRSYDQLVHDVALQNAPVVLGVDRAGLVGEDGPTHHGAFDISFLRHIPRVRILIPRDGKQLRRMLHAALQIEDAPVALRFPRGAPPRFKHVSLEKYHDVWQPQKLREGKRGLIIGVGPVLANCLEAAENISKDNNIEIAVFDLQCVKPLPVEILTQLAETYRIWMVVEDNAKAGGVGSALLEFVSDSGFDVTIKRCGLPDRFVTHGDVHSLYREVGLDVQSLTEDVCRLFCSKRMRIPPVGSKSRIKA